MKVYLVRHAKPDADEGLCYGRLDVSTDPARLAMTLASVRRYIPANALAHAPIYTSPLSRCERLARELAHPRTVIVADELSEIHLGSWEGRAWNDVPREELDNWARAIWTYRPGNGESVRAVADRWQRWLYQVALSDTEMAVAVTHAGVIRVALACAGRLELDDLAQSKIGFGSVHIIEHGGA